MDKEKQRDKLGRGFYILVAVLLLVVAFSSFQSTGMIINSIFTVVGMSVLIGSVFVLGMIIDWWWNDAKKDGKPSDFYLWVAGTIMLIPLWLLVIIPSVFGGILWVACDVAQVSDKYYFDSPCFDFDYRCTVECDRYNLNFTGVRNGCECDCGKGLVSSCSGFYYDKSPEGQDLIRIVGDEVVEYPNGTVEPAGYEAGIYAFNKSEPMVIDEEHKVGEL